MRYIVYITYTLTFSNEIVLGDNCNKLDRIDTKSHPILH